MEFDCSPSVNTYTNNPIKSSPNRLLPDSLPLGCLLDLPTTMVGPPRKRARREDKPEAELPQKKYYRQRAHANPFSDHDLK
jgi:hypothetical protein